LTSFVEIERNNANKLAEGVFEIIEGEISSLHITVADYAHWTDTYVFIAEGDELYEENNLLYGTYSNLDTAFIIFLNPLGEVVYSDEIDYEEEEVIIINPDVKKALLENIGEEERDGILVLDDGEIIIYSAVNVTYSDLSGYGGKLIMGRYLDESRIEKISSIIKQNLTIEAFSTTEEYLLEDFVEDNFSIVEGKEFLEIYSIIYDSSGEKILVSIQMPRDVYIEGKKTVNLFLLFFAIISFIFLFALLVLQSFMYDKAVLRLKKLENFTSEILKGNYSFDIKDELDEIGVLAKSFKKMAMGLDKKEKELKDLNVSLEQKVKDRTKQLFDKNLKLERAEKVKSDFLNIVTHELKTPLTAIMAYLDILKDSESRLNEEEKKSLETIRRNSKQLNGLIGNILEVARIESGKFELSLTEVDVLKKMDEIISNLGIIAKNKNLKLYSKVENIPKTIITDEQRFEEILNNLISNAIKFTEKGEIVVEAVKKGEMIEFTVRDSGVGISEDNVKKLFSDFYQVDSSVSRKYGGTGLGLSITKKLVEFQGGSVVVKSKIGEGSRFIFTLPIKQEPKKKKGGAK
jgi:signal transduction histidine kinase